MRTWHVGDHNLPSVLAEGFARGMFGDKPVLVETAILRGFPGFEMLLRMVGPQLASQLRSARRAPPNSHQDHGPKV